MQNGNLLATNKPEQLISEYKGRLYEVQTNKMQALVDDLRKMNKAGMIYRFGEFVHVTDETAYGNFENKLEEFLVKTGHGSILIREIRPVIEDSFLALMDKEQNR